ncbi:transcriptional regulator, LysR family [Methylobacterium sp. 4-46]|uniref:LysR substrate-binding domain-containing protein n=1 Tax=unclassified Methylobacterium TaxID=2615210 RepID=UPI000152CCF1|nr:MULTISPECIES: LysR substrate-binding domain-containing protein [Methylobacterium]ACA17691.1 transcriptional regulator, LysR family [Methylobacterium sp. 4-46]WFT83361.1 LysR substrate-binding domain-containing protein [Methylobacterium nodulans]
MNLAGLSLRDLEYVVAVAEEHHFGRAAERCAVSQPTLSVQVRKLEQALGVVIFERTNRRVLLTPTGQAVVRQARAVLAEARRLLLLAREGGGAPLSGRLVLAAIQTLGPYLFPLVLRPLRQDFPLLALALSEGRTAGILEGLREGRLDAALISLPIAEAGLTVAPLFREPFLLACPADHAFAAGDPPKAADLAGPDLLLLDEGNCLRDQTVAACGAGPSAGRHATSLETLRSMVAAGGGYTLLPALAAPSGPDPSGLTVCRRFGEEGPSRVIALAWRASDPRGEGLARLAGFFRAHAPAATLPCDRPERLAPA